MRHRRVLAIPLVACAVARAASAQVAPEPIAVEYEAPPDCPGRDAFFGEITARTPRARAARPGEKARVMRVTITKRGEAHAGRLVVEDETGASSPREVSATRCGEVVGALGLVAALAVDPRASSAPRPEPTATPETTPAEPPPTPGAPETKPAPAPPPPTPTGPPGPAPTPEGPPSARRARLAAGAGAEASAIAEAVLAFRVFGEIALATREGPPAPSLRLALARSLDVERSPAIGSATLRWTTGSLDLCPIGLAIGRTLAALPCAGLTVGVLDASGDGVDGAASRSRPWIAPDAHARLVWAPAPLFSVDLEGGAVFPLLRESFFFLPGVPVYEAPPVAALGRANVALHFP